MKKKLVESFIYRHHKGLTLPLEAILAFLMEGPVTVMVVLAFFEEQKMFSSATIHRYLMEGIEKKWVKLGALQDRRKKVVSITHEGKNVLAKIGGYYL